MADNFYYSYPQDIRLMEALGIKHFRMSISWSRILPDGTGTVNGAGLRFYSDLVDALLAAGVQPYVTLYHWDLPQVCIGSCNRHALCVPCPCRRCCRAVRTQALACSIHEAGI